MTETMDILCGTSMTDVQIICGTVFWCVAFIGVYVTICISRYLNLKYKYMAKRFSDIDDEHRNSINALCVRVTKLENELIKAR